MSDANIITWVIVGLSSVTSVARMATVLNHVGEREIILDREVDLITRMGTGMVVVKDALDAEARITSRKTVLKKTQLRVGHL